MSNILINVYADVRGVFVRGVKKLLSLALWKFIPANQDAPSEDVAIRDRYEPTNSMGRDSLFFLMFLLFWRGWGRS